MKVIYLLTIFLLLGMSFVFALPSDKLHSLTLLSVTELENGTLQGGTATLHLQIKKGSGSVFLESYPAVKIDTQAATRIAQEIACEFSSIDCSSYDFFYTIQANTPIIGGPSAGGATALLTLSALEEIPLKENVAMTGAISSGGIIVPVDGIREKIQGAIEANQKIAIIPSLVLFDDDELQYYEEQNMTHLFNESNYSKTILTLNELKQEEIEIYPVLTVLDALKFASKNSEQQLLQNELIPDVDYLYQMKKTAQELCMRTEELNALISEDLQSTELYNFSLNFSEKSKLAFEDTKYYSAASYCYTANLRLRQLLVDTMSETDLYDEYVILENETTQFIHELKQKTLYTFSDLEAYSIVRERLYETEQYLDILQSAFEDTNDSCSADGTGCFTNSSKQVLAFAIERYYSAKAWSGFFEVDGPELQLDQEALSFALNKELRNVQTRMSYLSSFLPTFMLTEIQDELDVAFQYRDEGETILALFKASKAKAQANVMLSVIGVREYKLSELIDAKLNRANTVIAKQGDVFPIIGFSYMEYSAELKETDSYSSLLFSEYALSLSDLSAYFPKKKPSVFSRDVFQQWLTVFIAGIICGVLLMLFIQQITKPKKKHVIRRPKFKS